MRLRLVVFGLLVVLALSIAGCGTKPADNATAAQPATGSGAASGAGGNQQAAGNKPGLIDRITGNTTITVPAGTSLAVRLDQTLSSKSSNAGDTFTATVVEPVSVDGKVVIPKNSEARGTVTDAAPLGRFKGGARLAIRLNELVVNGRTYNISTNAVARSLKGKGKRTAGFIGGGAAAGALIGGLTGGGKGAAIGAGVGAGAGTAGAAFTGNKQIVLPVETLLTFRISEAVEIKQ